MKGELRTLVMAALVAATLVLSDASSGSATILLNQNYDTDSLGSNSGWSTVTPPNYTPSVVNTQYSSSPKSLSFHNPTGNYATAYTGFAYTTENPTVIKISFDIKWVADPNRKVWGWKFGAGSYVSQGYLHDQAVYIAGGNFVWNGGPGYGFYIYNSMTNNLELVLGLANQDSIPGNWFHIEALLHYDGTANQTYDVTITQVTGGSASGTRTGVPFTTTAPLSSSQISAVWLDNVQTGAGADDLYLDNLKIETVGSVATMVEQAPFTLNGQNFFPIGIYGYPGMRGHTNNNAFFKELSEAGINTMLRIPTYMPVTYLDDAYAYGMGVSVQDPGLLYHVGDPDFGLMTKLQQRDWYLAHMYDPPFTDTDGHTFTYKSAIDNAVSVAKNHPATLCYQTIDEVYDVGPDSPPNADPDLAPPYETAVRNYYMQRLPHGFDYLHAQDPNHPVVECYYSYDFEDPHRPLDDCMVDAFRAGNTIGNVYGMWKYPVKFGPGPSDDTRLALVTQNCVELTRITNDPAKPVLMVLQGCAWSEYDDDPDDYIRPAWSQTRFTVYTSIVNGATGIFFWDPYYIERDSQFWADLKRIAGEIKYLKDPLNNGTVTAYSTGLSSLEAMLKTYNGYHYLIVVNKTPTAQNGVTVPAVPGWSSSQSQVLFENRFVGAPPFTENFQPWEVHIYTDCYDVQPSWPRSPAGFSAQPCGANSIVLNWTNPTSSGFLGTKIRYSIDHYPTSPTDGTEVSYQTDTAGSSDSYVHTGLNSGQTYYYSAFAYDGTNYSGAAHVQAIPLNSVAFTDDLAYSNSPLNGNGGWSGTASAGVIDVVGGTVKISGGATTYNASHSITCDGSGDKEIWVHCRVKAGAGDSTNDMWSIWINDPNGNNIARWCGTGTTVYGRIGDATTTEWQTIVTPRQALSGTGTWDDLHVKIFTTWGQVGQNGVPVPKKCSEFYFNGQFIGRLFYYATGAGYAVGSVAFERTGNSGATGQYLYFDDLRIGTCDFTLPTVTVGSPSPTRTQAGPVNYTINFNRSVLGFDSASEIRLNKTGTANAGSISVSGSGSGPYTVTLSGVTGDGTLGIQVKAGVCVDASGNPNDQGTNSATVAVGNTVPIPTIGPPSTSLTRLGPVTYTVNFNESVTGFGATDIQINATGSASLGSVEVHGFGSGPYTVTMSSITGNGTLGITVKAGACMDTAGNTSVASNPSTTFAVDNTPPTTTANPPAGTYNTISSVVLAANENATIHYTIDGSDPATGSLVYSEPIAIDNTTTLRFYAVDTAGNVESPKKQAIYTIVYTVTGSLVLSDYPGDVTQVPVQVELRKQGGSITTRTIHLDNSGNYSLTDVEAGAYDIAFTASHWLQKVVHNVQVGP